MKHLLLAFFLLLSAHSLLAQRDIENKLKLDMWSTPPAAFKVTTVPEKWKNESAVVLAFDLQYEGDYKGISKLFIEKVSSHYRIKLLDKAAVTNFSDISFDNKTIRKNLFGSASSYRIIGIKVIKLNGTEKEVDLSDAVKTDASSDKDLKIPIPNLEPGDIIDYYAAIKSEGLSIPSVGDEIMLEGKYPIVSNTYRFTLSSHYSFYSVPYNGAPDFKKEMINKKDAIYTLKSEMQEKAPDLLWEYEYRTSPHVRYRISGGDDEKYNPKTKAGEMMRGFGSNYSDIGYLEDFIKINFKKEKDTKKIIKELYYALRSPIYKELYFDMEQGNPMTDGYAPNQFFQLFDKYLDELKIAHDILLVPARSYGPLESVVNFSSCDLLIKVRTSPPIYLSRPAQFTLANEIPYSVEGMEGYCTTKGLLNNSPAQLSVSAVTENTITTRYAASLELSDIAKLHVKRNVVARGHLKTQHQYLVFTNYDYLKAYDQTKYQAESSRKMGGIIKKYQVEKKKFEQRMTQDYNDRDTRIKKDIERDMDTKVSDYSLTVKNIGMWETAPNVEYEDEFNLENMTKKAGPNIILEIGKLIGGQTDIPEEKMKRVRDIYMEYPRTYAEEISFAIPEGYTIEGIENLEKKIESDAGGFLSTSEIIGSNLVVKIKKYYNKNFYPSAEWPKITNFLAAAVDFYKAKVLLKKK